MTFFEWFYKTVVVQSVCILIILLSVVVMKYFFKSAYNEVEKFYREEILSDTSISEVLPNEI